VGVGKWVEWEEGGVGTGKRMQCVQERGWGRGREESGVGVGKRVEWGGKWVGKRLERGWSGFGKGGGVGVHALVC